MPNPSPDLILLIARVFPLVFIFAWGACVGSLLNVLAYRMPLGLSVVSPPSRCPCCETRLTWRENIPIFGWLFLRGRCRFCRSPISPEYPIVETIVALLFAAFVAVWYVIPNPYGGGPVFLGVDWHAFRPPWASNPVGETWPYMLLVLILVSCLAAMTLIDAKTYTIPLALPWTATIAAMLIHPAHALYIQYTSKHLIYHSAATDYRWFIPTTNNFRLLCGCGGAVFGLGVALLMLRFKLISRSFADYEEWEKSAIAEAQSQEAAQSGSPKPGAANGGQEGSQESPAHLWIQYPHARREMVRELAFLAPLAVFGYAGYMLAAMIWPAPIDTATSFTMDAFTPLWAEALGGVLLGYLVGGGIVWAVRIGGSIGFGKEAMGMGDVHLLAAVGACVGWVYAVLAFFAAAMLGVLWAVLSAVTGGKVSRAMPYGPFLAAATLLVLLLRPVILHGINLLVGTGPGVVPINFP